MSIANFLPPICDPDDGHLLLDGCYVNNVPGKYQRFQDFLVLDKLCDLWSILCHSIIRSQDSFYLFFFVELSLINRYC